MSCVWSAGTAACHPSTRTCSRSARSRAPQTSPTQVRVWPFPRHCERAAHLGVASAGIICDLLWSDPDKDIEGWGENDRGVSFTFGGDIVAKFLKKHDLDLVCRAHQVMTGWMLPLARLASWLGLCSSGRRGRLRVLRQAAAGDHLLRPELLRRVRQRRRHDERGRDPHVLLPGILPRLPVDARLSRSDSDEAF